MYLLVQGIQTEFANLFPGGVIPKKLGESPTLPAMTYQLISSPNEDVTMNGPSGLVLNERWQFTIWAKTYDEVVQLSDVFRVRVNGIKGYWGSVAVVTRKDDERDDRDEKTGLERRDIDVFVTYNR